MFGRKTSKAPVEEAPPKEGGKGHPTPTRKQAEAEARARAKASATGVDPRKSNREQRIAQNRVAREGWKRGEERYLPQRDRGPVRRFLRDLVDSRFRVSELLMPLLLIYIVLGYVNLLALAQSVLFTTVIFVGGDLAWLTFSSRREFRRRFDGKLPFGSTNYMFMRAIMIRRLRRPEPQVKMGQPLPETYK